MCGAFFWGIGGWVGGTRSYCFNCGYHDLGHGVGTALLIYLCICNIFNITVSNIGCIVSNDCMSVNNELQKICEEVALS